MDAIINQYEKLLCRVYTFRWWESVKGGAKAQIPVL